MTLCDRLIAYENGELDMEDQIDLFSDLVRSGLAWTLQGSYGRMAHAMIREGFLQPDGTVNGADVYAADDREVLP